MPLFHKHEFHQHGERTLWCKCGRIKVLECEHTWEFVKDEISETRSAYSNKLVERATLRVCRCKKCGEFGNF